MPAGHSGPIVWLASYPKSGNTWVRALLAAFLGAAGGDRAAIALAGTMLSDRAGFDAVTGLASSDLTLGEITGLLPGVIRFRARGVGDPGFVKTHAAFRDPASGIGLHPPDASRAAILIVRNPLDIAASLAAHRGEGDPGAAVAALNTAGHVIAGHGMHQLPQITGDWSQHGRSWREQRDIPLLCVRYEDLLDDTACALVAMLRFLGVPGSGDASRVAAAVAACGFARMRALEQSHGFAERPAASSTFFRGGVAGEGRFLPADLRAAIVARHGALMAELGYRADPGAG